MRLQELLQQGGNARALRRARAGRAAAERHARRAAQREGRGGGVARGEQQ